MGQRTRNRANNVKKTIRNLPENSWLVFNLHGLDGEGWQPWSSKSLKDLLNFIEEQSINIGNISEIINLI